VRNLAVLAVDTLLGVDFVAAAAAVVVEKMVGDVENLFPNPRVTVTRTTDQMKKSKALMNVSSVSILLASLQWSSRPWGCSILD
jgi:hypothetical protein